MRILYAIANSAANPLPERKTGNLIAAEKETVQASWRIYRTA